MEETPEATKYLTPDRADEEKDDRRDAEAHDAEMADHLPAADKPAENVATADTGENEFIPHSSQISKPNRKGI